MGPLLTWIWLGGVATAVILTTGIIVMNDGGKTTTTTAATTNLTFVESFHSSIPDVYRTEYSRIFERMRKDFPTLTTAWLDEVTVYAWITEYEARPFGEKVYGMSVSGDGVNTWIALEYANASQLFDPSPAMAQKYSVIAHEYFHVYQRTLARAFEPFDVKWLIEGTAAVLESLVVRDMYGVEYFDAGQSYQNMTLIATHPERHETYAEDEANYSDSVFMLLCLLRKLATPRVAFHDFWTALDVHATWQEAFIATFGMSVEAFYADLKANCSSLSLTSLTGNITIADIVK